MKKSLPILFFLLLIIPTLSGCEASGKEVSDLSVVYIVTAFISLLPLFSVGFLSKNTKKWFILLFSSVFVVNAGYAFLSLSSSLKMALWANRISYLGSVYLPVAMMMIILNVVNANFKKWLPLALFLLSTALFFVTASPGYLDIYYKDVSFEIVNGTSKLVKVYGILHPLYLFYLIGYFGSMVAIIIRARIKKTTESTSHANIIALAVLVNIFVWLTEQFVRFEFEFLSVSYIISELFLLGVHLVAKENQNLRTLVKESQTPKEEKCISENHTSRDNISEKATESRAIPEESTQSMGAPKESVHEKSSDTSKIVSEEAIEAFTEGLKRLTPTEKAIYELYISGKTTKEIMSELGIKENTLKFHNKNLYGKLGVSSRKQLFEIHESIK